VYLVVRILPFFLSSSCAFFFSLHFTPLDMWGWSFFLTNVMVPLFDHFGFSLW